MTARSKRERIEARFDARDLRWWRRQEVLTRGKGKAGGLSPWPPYEPGKRPSRRAVKAAQPMWQRGQFFGRLTPHWITPSNRYLYVEPVKIQLGAVALCPNGEVKAVEGRGAVETYYEFGPIDFTKVTAGPRVHTKETALLGRRFAEQRYGMEARAVFIDIIVYSEFAEDASRLASQMIHEAFMEERKARDAQH